jgi:hypothetical protein
MIAAPRASGVELEPRTEPAEIESRGQTGTEGIRPAGATGEDETLYLIGRPTLKQFIRFARSNAVHPQAERTLADEWQAANDLARALASEEPGIADDPPMRSLGNEYEPLLVEFLKDPLVRYGFNTVPTDVAIVELDRMVVSQKHIDLTYARQLEARLGPAPDRDQIFRTCLPFDHPQPPVKWSRVNPSSFVFMSPSNDLRYLGPMRIGPAHLTGYPPPGDLVGVIGAAVGFGSNFMGAIYAERRLILHNGSHRAYTLRKMGITHAPCIIQHASSRDELDLVASSEVREHPDRYLKDPRPSMLKDYFNPKLHTVMAVHRRLRQISVKLEIEETYVPAL